MDKESLKKMSLSRDEIVEIIPDGLATPSEIETCEEVAKAQYQRIFERLFRLGFLVEKDCDVNMENIPENCTIVVIPNSAFKEIGIS